MPDFSDKAMNERHLDGLRDALLYLNMPAWLVDLTVSYRAAATPSTFRAAASKLIG